MKLAKGTEVVLYAKAILLYETEIPPSSNYYHYHRTTIKVKSQGRKSGWMQTTLPTMFVHDAQTFSFHQPTGRELPFRFAEGTKDTDKELFIEAMVGLAQKQGIVLETIK